MKLRFLKKKKSMIIQKRMIPRCLKEKEPPMLLQRPLQILRLKRLVLLRKVKKKKLKMNRTKKEFTQLIFIQKYCF